MMLKTCLLMTLMLSFFTPLQAQEDGAALLRRMHAKYKGAVCRSYSFSQRNTHYKNDTVSGRSEWHETIEFPDKFRIMFGDISRGNYVQFRNDSVYQYRQSALVRAASDSNNLLLLLGGMYHRDVADALARLKAKGYDLARLSEQDWNGSKVYVIGALSGDLQSNQVWVDRKKLIIVRIIEKMNDKDRMDMRFESHQPLCKGMVENKVSFRRNGKLEQVEEYYDVRSLD